jgi:capsular exopolysaccharide synthesis family protein
LIDAYLGKLIVSPVEGTRLVDISFAGRYPKLITQIVNTHAKTYIEQNLRRKFNANQLAEIWLSRGLEELREKEVKAEKALQQFKEKEDIISLDSMMFSEKSQGDNIIVQNISQINNNLTAAKLRRIELGAVYEQLKQIISNPGEVEVFPEIMQDPLIRTYKQDYANMIRQYLEISERYGEKHPKMISLKSEMEEKKSSIKVEAEKLAKSMEAQYRTAKDNEEKVERTLNEYKQEALLLNRKALEYDILKRDVDSNRDLYEYFLRRLKETNITSGNTASNISIVDPAEVPSFPVGQNRRQFILLSVMLGLTVGIGLTFLFEYLDNTIKSPSDIDIYLRRLPFLGPIGSFSTLESELITFIKPESNFSESFRNLRTNLLLNASNNGYKTFLITSPDRGEGKTLVSANLAIAMTKNREKVLLIDANMRMPRLYSLFGVENSPGLSDLLKGSAILETIVKSTEIDGVSILTAGKIPLDPLELLSSESMASIVGKMRERFDSIVIDAPGMSVGPDSAVISRLVDGVVMLTQFGKTPRTLAQQAIDQLSNIQVKLVGVVINNIDYKRGRYHFPYYGLLLKDDSRIDMYMVERINS